MMIRLLQLSYNMKIVIVTILVLALIAKTVSIHMAKPIKAMLYCYLPAVDTQNPIQEYQNLARIINDKLVTAKINVEVEVCDPDGQGTLLYDQNAIDSLFNYYDILEVDVSYLWAISTDLLTFKKSEIDYYDDVFAFEWDPLRIPVEGDEDQLKGSPGLMCSTFIETRQDDNYEDRLYGKFNAKSAYGLVDLYLNLYINNEPERTLDDVDYTSVEDSTIAQVADFLKDCQEDNSVFDYQANWCLQKLKKDFFKTNYSRTTGYSENLFNFQNAGIDTGYIGIDHITEGRQKKMFYVDSFVAKDGLDRDTVLAFYKFMLSDEVLDVYVKGLYTKNPKTTYLIPPTIKYIKQISRVDDIYRAISRAVFIGQQYPLYQPSFAKNLYTFAALIDQALQEYKNSE